ncbi:uncharacterized protein LOC133832497 [Humulus lupulus]|uniref:uncharacterized protein LOC133832497 n=1 Tax=Humulus lupulus TaxID=3486 RepID=UPI002B4146FB|nr:uncharacterized protein LOC133832497 [Humulus lupulus]
MSAEDPFNLYSEPDPVAPVSKKKGSRQHRGESNNNPPMKKTRTEDPPILVPSKETTPPPAPVDQPSPPAPMDQTLPPTPADQTPPTPTDQTPPNQTGEALMNMALISAKDRLTKLLRHQHSREAISNTDSMEVEQIFNRALNEVPSGVLTMSAGWRCSGALIAQYEKRLGEQLRASEDKHAEELKTAEAKYNEQLEVVEKKNAELFEQKAKLAEELKQYQDALTKAIETKEKYKEASLINFKEASKLQVDMVISRKETKGLEEHVKELEETNASNLEKYKGTTFKCFYMFWKNNCRADFSYLPDRMR